MRVTQEVAACPPHSAPSCWVTRLGGNGRAPGLGWAPLPHVALVSRLSSKSRAARLERGEDFVLQKGSRSRWSGVFVAQQRCRVTRLSLGLGAEACIRVTRVLASELGSLGGSLPAAPPRPCPWSPPTPGSVPPSCSGRYPLNTCTGGATLATVHCGGPDGQGPAILEDRCVRAEGEGPRRKARAWLQAGKTHTPPQGF